MVGLIDMAKIIIGDPSTIWKENLMKCTVTIQPENMINGMMIGSGSEKSLKRTGPGGEGMVKTQMETV